MIKITELLHVISTEKKEGMVPVDDWKFTDFQHLMDMGFEFGDDFHMVTTKDPKITVYKKKDDDKIDYFFIEEPDKEKKRFKEFNDVIDYFDGYSQPELDKKM